MLSTQAAERSAPLPVDIQIPPLCRIDNHDPVAHFICKTLRWDWPQFLLVLFLIYGPIEKFLIPSVGGYFHLSLTTNVTKWVPDVEALLTGFLEFPFFLAFYLWSGRGILDPFNSLACSKSFANPERYTQFLQRLPSSFDRRLWPAVSLGFALLVILVMHLAVWAPGSAAPPWFGSANTAHRILALILIGFVAYGVGQILIREVLAIVWLRRLWHEMDSDLVVHPYHADDAGGLGGIGQHAINFSYFLMIVMLFIIMATLLPQLRGQGDLALTFGLLWSPLIILMWVLYILIVPMSFGFVIWPSHRSMTNALNTQLNSVSTELDKELAAAKTSAASDPSQLPDILKRIEELKALRVLLLQDFPTWPTNATIRRQLSLSSLFPAAFSLFTWALNLLIKR